MSNKWRLVLAVFGWVMGFDMRGAVVWYYDQQGGTAPVAADWSAHLAIQDTTIMPTSPDSVWSTSGQNAVQQYRVDSPKPVSADLLMSFSGLFGGAGIPNDATINHAYLYLNIDTRSGVPAINLKGLNASAAGWSESQATFNHMSSGVPWNLGSGSGNFGDALSVSYGTITAPSATGWYAVDVTAALLDYRQGTIGGLVLEGSSTPVVGVANFYAFDDSAGNSATAPGLLVDFTPVPEPSSIALVAGLGLLGWSMVRRRKGRQLAASLALLAGLPGARAEQTWVVGKADPVLLGTVAGQAGQVLRAQWKDLQVCELQPGLNLSGREEIGIQQPRSFPAASGMALIGLEGVFGLGSGQIPNQAVIDEAWLWLHVSSGGGTLTVEVRALPATDADWRLSEAAFAGKAAGATWSNGTLAGSFTEYYGQVQLAGREGWLRLPVDLADWLAGLQQGRVSALALDPGATVTHELRNLYFDADHSAQCQPGLLAKWHLPAGAPQLARCPAKVSGHGPLVALAVAAVDASEVTVDGQRAVRTGPGDWKILLAPGQHQVRVANALGQAEQLVQIEQSDLRVMALAGPDGGRQLTWTALPGYRYQVEGGDLARWQAIPGEVVASADGDRQSFSISSGAQFPFFRVAAQPQ